jgi:cell wall-associated NlpC family hydrolase
MEASVLRLVPLCAILVCILAFAAAALARGGPVFTVVSSGGGQHESLNQTIHRQLKTNRLTLTTVLRAQRIAFALLRRTQAEIAQAADPFPADARAARFQQQLAANKERASRIRRTIRGLELALRPVAVPVTLRSSSPVAIGSYAVSIAERYLGVRYVWGGGDPSSGFDCSGFVRYVYAQLGIRLPHYAASQYAITMHVDPSQLQPGDLVFFEPRADGPGHVGMYVGNGVFIEAPHTGEVVKLTELSTEASLFGFVGASRPAA